MKLLVLAFALGLSPLAHAEAPLLDCQFRSASFLSPFPSSFSTENTMGYKYIAWNGNNYRYRIAFRTPSGGARVLMFLLDEKGQDYNMAQYLCDGRY